jgi:hypothetical protein
MTRHLETALEQLRQSLTLGQDRLAQLDTEAAQLRHDMLSLAGKIQLLEEILVSEAGGDPPAN